MPQRIQRQRTRGWRKPDGVIYVGRGSKWGNPYRVVAVDLPSIGEYPGGWRVRPEPSVSYFHHLWFTEREAAERAVHLYRFDIERRLEGGFIDLSPLAGRDLMCWCAPNMPCHADVLLELANKED